MVEKVKRKLNGWQTKGVFWGVSDTTLVGAFHNSFFFLLVFKLPLGIGKVAELEMVSWDVECKPVNFGGSGVLQVQTMNLELLIKQVCKIMSLKEDLVMRILNDNHITWLDWESE